MIGDGVNDVLPIKRADLGIAMGEGCQAAKTVAGLVLEKNDFAMLPETIEEGRTIVRNVRRAAKLFLVKNVYSLLMILFFATGLFGLPFPYLPQQVTLLNWLVIGVPAFIIALDARTLTSSRENVLRERRRLVRAPHRNRFRRGRHYHLGIVEAPLGLRRESPANHAANAASAVGHHQSLACPD